MDDPNQERLLLELRTPAREKLPGLDPNFAAEELKRELAYYVVEGQESPAVDLKWCLPLNSTKQKKEFAKDVASLANAVIHIGGRGYLILGALDKKEADQTPEQPRFPCFESSEERGRFHSRIVDISLNYCDPPPDISYQELFLGSERYGLVIVKKPTAWPVWLHYDQDGKDTWEIWTRSGERDPKKHRAGPRTIMELYLDYLHHIFPSLAEDEWTSQVARMTKPSFGSIAGVMRFLAMSLVDDQSAIRAAAVRCLREIGGLGQVEKALVTQVLLGLLTDTDYQVVWETARTLGQLGDVRAVQPLVQHCLPGKQDIPFEALSSLKRLGDSSHSELLRPLLSDRVVMDNQDLYEAVLKTIQALGGRIELPGLVNRPPGSMLALPAATAGV